MSDKVFISYCHRDFDFAKAVADKLKENGFETWMDFTRWKGGQGWKEEIDRNIRDSSALVLVVSPHSKDSFEVTYEWVFALGAGSMIVPIMLEDIELHPRLKDFQYRDFTSPSARPWDILIDDLKTICMKEHGEKSEATHVETQAGSIETPTNCIENAVWSLHSADLNERQRAIDILIKCQILSKEALLIALKRNPSSDVRYGIARKFGEEKFEDGIPELIETLEDPDNSVRAIAAWALGNLGDDAAVTGLKRALGDPDNSVRRYAVQSLGRIGDKEAAPELTEALKDADDFVREEAAQALKRLELCPMRMIRVDPS
jgi:hypothetical protein